MKKFRVEVTRIDEYIIEIDENFYNDEWLKDFRRSFYDFFTLEQIAEHLAQHQARFGTGDSFIEGFGDIKRDGRCSFGVKEEDAAPGLNIVIVDEDDDIEMETTEIK